MLELLGSGGLGGLVQPLRDALPIVIALVAALSVLVLLSRLLGGGAGSAARPGLLSRIGSTLGAAFTTNWQLTLLATTALVLSLASGWTTWDGMRNFTGEPVLSLMVTFGIQGVMLIIAWLIGESFASGMRRGDPHRRAELTLGSVVGGLAFVGLATMVLRSFGAFDGIMAAQSGSWVQFADKALLVGVALLIVAALMLNQRSSLVEPYVQSAKVMAKNAVLWVMFLSCMATSVFFSFDSLFSSIFPQDERRRAADIRASRQVAGVVNDIGALAVRRQAEEAEHLFKNPGWAAYAKQLAELSRASQGAEEAIERYFVERMEAHKSAMAAQQERIATAKSGQAGLSSRKGALTDELARLKGERPTLAAELAEKKTELDSRTRGLDAKRVEMMAEEKGAEGTLKAGQGPVFRQRKAELQQLQDAFKIQEERVRDAQKRLQTVDTRVAQVEREIAAIDGDVAKLKGEADTAAQRIAVAEQSKAGDADTPKVDPARVRTAFERAHADFRQEPTAERLNTLATQCTQLLTAMASTPATKERVRAIDCDPKQANEAAARVFALNAGLVTFAQNCVGGSKLPTGGTDVLLTFGRKCLQDSGLPGSDSADMAAKISSIDLNRDDKAHRFVVTWNAFADGNRLAYLALSIAIAIDSLVFMSGLFGANAVRSPLTSIGMRDPMSADELGAIIDGALHNTPHPRETLQAILGSLHPIADGEEFTAEISLDEIDPGIVREVRQVLTAAGTIEAVRPVGNDRVRYVLHYGLIRYLGIALKKAPQIHREQLDRKELVNVVGVALLPDPQHNADVVLGEMHPISDAQGYAAETSPFKIADHATRRLVINTLGAGATVPGAVKRSNDDGRYFVSTDFYKTLLLMRAAAIPAFTPDAVQRRFAGPSSGGMLRTGPAPSVEASQLRQIEDQGPRPRGATQRGEPPSSHRQPPPAPQPRPASVPGVMPAASPPSAPPPLPVAAVPVPQQPAPRKPQSSRLASEIRAAIIARGLHPWSDQEIEAAWHTHADRRLYKALADLVARSAKLGEIIDAAMQEYQELVEEAFQDLRDEHAGDPNYVQVLESEVQKLKRLMPVLVMTPSGPYEQIIEAMIRDLRTRGGILEDQVGNGRLSNDELGLLKGLEKHLYQLRQLPASTLDRAERLATILDAYREGVSADLWSGGGDAPPVT